MDLLQDLVGLKVHHNLGFIGVSKVSFVEKGGKKNGCL